MGNSHAAHHRHAIEHGGPFPTTVGGNGSNRNGGMTILMPQPKATQQQVVNASVLKETLSRQQAAAPQQERRNSVPLLGIRSVLARPSPSSSKMEVPMRSATPPPVLPSSSSSVPPPAAPLEQQTSSSSSSTQHGMPPHPPVMESPSSSSSSSSSADFNAWGSVRRMPRVRSLAKKASSSSSRGLCSLKRRIVRQKTLKVVPVPCQICPPGHVHNGACTNCPIQRVCSDAFSHIMRYLSIPEICATTRVSHHIADEVDNTLARLQDASFLAQGTVKLDLLEENQRILKVLSEKCPRIRRLKSQTYVRLSREQCQVLFSGCPRIQQVSPSIEFQAADIVSVGRRFPDLTEARVHFSAVKEAPAFGDACPAIRSLLIDSDNDQIGEIAAVLGERLPRFKFLSVDLCARSVPRAGVDKIPEKLTLALSVVGNIQKEHCVTLTKCRSNLVTLHLHHIPPSDFPVEGLRYLSRHMPSLKELDLPHTTVSMIRPIDNEISQVLSDSKGFPALKRLYLKRYSSTFRAILSKSKGHVKLGRRSCS